MCVMERTRTKLTSSAYSIPAYTKPAAVHSAEQESGVMFEFPCAKYPRVREAASIQHPAYERPCVDVDEGAIDEAVVVELEDLVEVAELETAELEGTEDVLDAEDTLDVVLEGTTLDALDPETVYTDSLQLAPHMTAESPAQGMLQSESGARVLSAKEFPQ
jgi:hypothetical protein